jgi:hypothetical protein
MAADETRAILGDKLDVLIANAGLMSTWSQWKTFSEL